LSQSYRDDIDEILEQVPFGYTRDKQTECLIPSHLLKSLGNFKIN